MANDSTLIRLRTSIQHYPWGKQGSSSLVARLANNSVGPDFSLDQASTYAEIWMGTHPNGPSSLFSSPSTSLRSLIASTHFPPSSRAHALSKVPVPAEITDSPGSGRDTTHIPFLFKILSIQKALPLQAHPDKHLAARVRHDNPDLAPDANHKPEIAIAIGKPLPAGRGEAFTGFVGFRPLDDIVSSLNAVKELTEAVGDDRAVDAFIASPSKDTLKTVWTKLLERGPSGEAKPCVESLAERVSKGDTTGLTEEQAWLVDKVSKQYPGDVGALATTFFMNLCKLKRGEALWIGADEVHAYLEGDIIECMAISDNVFNAAFSAPEELAAQLPTFVDALTYTARPAAHWALLPRAYARSARGRTAAYAPPLEEFAVLGTHLRAGTGTGTGTGEETLRLRGPAIGVVTRGKVRVRVRAGGEEVGMEEGAVVYVVPRGGDDDEGGVREVDVVLEEGDADGEGEVWWAVCE